MPFACTKQQKKKQYYVQHRQAIRAKEKLKYAINKKCDDDAIDKRQKNSEKKRDSIRDRVAKYRSLHPEKSKSDTRRYVSDSRSKNPDKARADSRRGVSRYCARNPDLTVGGESLGTVPEI